MHMATRSHPPLVDHTVLAFALALAPLFIGGSVAARDHGTTGLGSMVAEKSKALSRQADVATKAQDWPLAIQLWRQYVDWRPRDAEGWMRLGSAYLDAGQFEPAVAAKLQATLVAPNQSAAWAGLCWSQIAANQPGQGRQACAKALTLNKTDLAAIVNLGHTYLLTGDLTTAQDLYEQSIKSVSSQAELEQGPLEDFALFIKQGWHAEAARHTVQWYAQSGASWLRQVGPLNNKLNIATTAFAANDFTQANALLDEALAGARPLFGNQSAPVFRVLDAIQAVSTSQGMQALQSGNYGVASTALNRAKWAAEQHWGSAHLATLGPLNNLATMHQALGRYIEAEAIFLHVASLSETIEGPMHRNTSASLNNLASLQLVMGKQGAAEPLLERARQIIEPLGDEELPLLGAITNHFAVLAKDTGQFSKAEKLYQRALSMAERSEGSEHPSTAKSLGNLADLYRALGQADKAEPLYLRALAIAQRHEGAQHPSTGTYLSGLALLYRDVGKLPTAEALLLRSLAIAERVHGADHPDTSARLNNLAGVHRSRGSLAKAEPLYLRALRISEAANGQDHSKTGAILNNLAYLYRDMGRIEDAEQSLLRAANIATLLGQPELQWTVQDSLRALYAGNSPDLAIWHGKQAVNILQKIRAGNANFDHETQSTFLKKNAGTYKGLADLLFAKGRLAEGTQIMSMLKESEYFDFVRRSSANDPRKTQSSFSEAEKPWAIKYESINGQLAAMGNEREALAKRIKAGDLLSAQELARKGELDANLTIARQAFSAFVQELKLEFNRAASADRQQELGEMNLASLRALQGTLRELGRGAVTLHYLVMDKRLWILLTTPTVQIKRESTITEAELNRLVGQYREAIAERAPNVKDLGKRLDDVLMAPVAEDLRQAQAKTLMLSLDGVLRYLPMAALYDGERYLAQRYRLAIFTSAAQTKLKDPTRLNWTLAGFGLTQKHPDFDALPTVRDELVGIMSGMSGAVKFDNEFNAKTFKAGLDSEPAVVHIASHFVFQPGDESESYLLLGDGTKLSLREIKEGYEFTNLDLLTLSACETAIGGGKDRDGREVEGFAALAQNQGAKGVVATLWPVADQSTSQFMQLLYGIRQANPGMTKAEAMQRAQTAFIEGKVASSLLALPQKPEDQKPKTALETPYPTDHPYFWAPFVLMGNWL
jgi:CHAT domain-containing protein/Tfp pilus assembly protein PilF